MWALVTKDGKIIARDFPTRIAAIQHKAYYVSTKDAIPIDQNSKRFVEIDYKAKRK
jgi:hypothetical protein